MSDLQSKKQKSFAAIATAQTILENYPTLSSTSSYLSAGVTGNPLDYLMDLLKSTGGYDQFIQEFSRILVYASDGIELMVKAVLLTNLKNMICSLNPMIPDYVIRNGITLSMNAIDLSGYMLVNPMDDEIGKYYYFGCDDITSVSQLENANDFNAVLWFAINKAVGRRVIWDDRNTLLSGSNPNATKNPIITMEFVTTSMDLRNSDWSNAYMQVPFNNIIHIMLGDTRREPLVEGELVEENVTENRYYRRTLVEFNTQFVNSMKLFDSKVVCAQLLDQITGMISVTAGFSIQQQYSMYEVQKIVDRIVESDDYDLNDCYYTFSNDEYNDLLTKAELVHAGLYSKDGEDSGSAKISAKDILNQLNGLSDNATLEEKRVTIEGAITNLSSTISRFQEDDTTKVSLDVKIYCIEDLTKNLIRAVVMSLFSPKVFILFAVNNYLLGKPDIINIQGFIAQNKQLITNLVRNIRNVIIQLIVDFLKTLIEPLIAEVTARIGAETIQYYRDLIILLLRMCSFRGGSGELDFTLDEVSPDIVEQQQEPKTDQC